MKTRLAITAVLAAIAEQIGADAARSGLAPTACAALAVDLPLARWLALRVLWSGGVELIRADGELTVTPEVRASLGAVWRR